MVLDLKIWQLEASIVRSSDSLSDDVESSAVFSLQGGVEVII